jgi:hypothetical protein
VRRARQSHAKFQSRSHARFALREKHHSAHLFPPLFSPKLTHCSRDTPFSPSSFFCLQSRAQLFTRAAPTRFYLQPPVTPVRANRHFFRIHPVATTYPIRLPGMRCLLRTRGGAKDAPRTPMSFPSCHCNITGRKNFVLDK